jgi:carboxypeptidase Taq
MEAYGELVKIFTRLHRFGHLSAIANWDAMVNMPPKGAEARGAALAELDVLIHSIITDKALAGHLGAVKLSWGSFTPIERANVREMERAWKKQNKLPSSLVERAAVAATNTEQAWRKMRVENNWDGFVPHFKKVLGIAKETGALLAKDTDLLPYEALMDQYEPGMRIATLDAAFGNIQGWLPQLLREVMARGARGALKLWSPRARFPWTSRRRLASSA